MYVCMYREIERWGWGGRKEQGERKNDNTRQHLESLGESIMDIVLFLPFFSSPKLLQNGNKKNNLMKPMTIYLGGSLNFSAFLL